MVLEPEGESSAHGSAIVSTFQYFGCTAECLRGWVCQAEADRSRRAGPSTAVREWLREAERENRELRRALQIRECR